MHLGVSWAIIGLLKDLIGPDARLFHEAVSGDIQGGAVHVYPADRAAVLGGVNDSHGMGDSLGSVVGVLPVVDHQALMAFAHERVHFGPQLVVGQSPADDLSVLPAEPAVPTGVDALVADVERGE